MNSFSVSHSASQLSSVPSIPLVWLLLALLEGGVHPYDVVECEPELVSGYYVDMGGALFVICYLSESILLHSLRNIA